MQVKRKIVVSSNASIHRRIKRYRQKVTTAGFRQARYAIIELLPIASAVAVL